MDCPTRRIPGNGDELIRVSLGMRIIINFLPLIAFTGFLTWLAWWLSRRLSISFSSEGLAQHRVRPWFARIALLVGALWLGLVVLQLVIIGLATIS